MFWVRSYEWISVYIDGFVLFFLFSIFFGFGDIKYIGVDKFLLWGKEDKRFLNKFYFFKLRDFEFYFKKIF